MFNDTKQQIDQLPRTVQNWMLWLNIVFLLGLFFVFNYVEARWAVFIWIASFPVGFSCYYFIRDLSILGIPHIILWVPLLVYLYHSTSNDPGFSVASPYGIWLLLLSATIVISAVLDTKAIIDFVRLRAK